jgi:hypothetical protein
MRIGAAAKLNIEIAEGPGKFITRQSSFQLLANEEVIPL